MGRFSLRTVCVFAALIASAQAWPLPDNVTPEFDCAMRRAAYSYGKKILPRKGSFESLYYALDLNNASCKTALVDDRAPTPSKDPASTPDFPPGTVFVSPNGSDQGNLRGTESDPFLSIQRAVDLAAKSESPKLVVLRSGTYYLKETLQYLPKHSGVEVRKYPGDKDDAVISGGVKVDTDWKPYDVTENKNIWVTNLKSQNIDDVPGLQINGRRATRARYPNLPAGIEVSPGYSSMIPGGSAKWTPPDMNKYGPVHFFTDNTSSHLRPNGGWFEEYMIGVDGLCSVYDPPVSYWCSEHPSGGGAFAFRTPSGVKVTKEILPNSPYKDVSQGIFFVWRPARWANWMFEVADYDPTTNNFTFGRGGFQGARGNNQGGDFFVENVFEELDFPGEFFFNASTGDLYVYHNGTGAPPKNNVVVPNLIALVNMTGTQWDPVKNVVHRGVMFSASRYTYMEPHGVPSAGDWALDRYGAVFLQGTESITFNGCTFARLDGNAVMISGYNRNATISNNDFSYIGGNAIAAWGYTNETKTDPGRPGVQIENAPYAGVDGTDGNHPRYTNVIGNVAREVGLYEKQSSFFVQAKTAQSTISGNVFFNGPRAGVNMNDGFGGGDEISHNLVFSACRESGDHGPFNSWDRQPFLTTVRTEKPSMIMAWRSIHHNFFIDNYSPQENVDNDDGSSYYHTHDNFLVYATNGEKSDFGGHDNFQYNNIYAYVGEGLGLMPQVPNHPNKFYSNKVVMTGEKVGRFECHGTNVSSKTELYDNRYFTPTGEVNECGEPLAQWQKEGNDKGSTVAKLPEDKEIIQWAKTLLGF